MTVHVHQLPLSRGFGRHVEHDPKSLLYSFTPTLSLPTEPVEWTSSAPGLNQMDYNGCVGNGFAQFLNCDVNKPLRDKLAKPWFTEGDALSIYDLATRLDGLHGTGPYAPQVDDGSSGLGGAKACLQLGYITGYQHTFSFGTFLHALATQPVVVGTAWTNTMQDTDGQGFLTVGTLDDSNVAGGHEYLAVGFHPLLKLVKFRNSWGPGWGKDGYFYVSYADFQRLLIAQGDVVVPKIAA